MSRFMSKAGRLSRTAGLVFVLPPLMIAFVGPYMARPQAAKGIPSLPGEGGVMGTDFAGRDVLNLVLSGGRTAVLVALVATLAIYVLAIPLGTLAAMTERRWLDELVIRPLDLVLAIPSLLLVLLVASRAPGRLWPLLTAVVLVGAAETIRLARAAALEIGGRPTVEAMRLQGESWATIAFGYVARNMAGTLLADLGTRFTASIYLVATASFLGAGVSPQTHDWATTIEANRGALSIQPWPVLVPALLIASLVVGVNLLVYGFTTGNHEARPGSVVAGSDR